MAAPQSVFITGASRGLGQAMAVALLQQPGNVPSEFYLTARSPEGLEATATQCRTAAEQAKVSLPELHLLPADVRDAEPLAEALLAQAGEAPDLIILNAGISAGLTPDDTGAPPVEPLEATRRQFQVNTLAPLALLEHLLPAMTVKGGAHVVVVLSLAARLSIPSYAGYSASKAALLNYFRAVRADWLARGIRLTLLLPGFIDTDMNRRLKPGTPLFSPQSWPVERAARVMVQAIREQRAEYAFPFAQDVLSRGLAWLPTPLQVAATRYFLKADILPDPSYDPGSISS